MLLKWFHLFFPMIGSLLRCIEGGEGGGSGSEGGDGGSGGVVDNGGSQSREIPADGGRQRGAGGEKPWYEAAGLDASALTDKDKEYKTLADYVKGAQSARTLAASKGIPIPGKDATDEQKAAFRGEVMKHFPDLPVAPESADKYEIPLYKDSGLAEERQKEINAAFHKAGYSNAQAQAAIEIWSDQVAKDMAEAQAVVENQRKATDAELKREWGADYADRMAGIDRIGEKYPELMGALKASGLDARKDFRVLMDEVARSISEDHPGGAGGETVSGLDTQIATLRSQIKGTENSLERKRMTDQLAGLYEKRSKLRK